MSIMHKGTRIASKSVSGDTLPVGSVIEYEGSVVPPGYEQVQSSSGKSYKEYELYNNASGTTGNITLSETAANFVYLEIFFQANGDYNSVKIYSPNGKNAYLTINVVNAAVNYWQEKLIAISGTAITNVVYNQTALGTGSGSVTNVNNILITRVVGYKEM